MTQTLLFRRCRDLGSFCHNSAATAREALVLSLSTASPAVSQSMGSTGYVPFGGSSVEGVVKATLDGNPTFDEVQWSATTQVSQRRLQLIAAEEYSPVAVPLPVDVIVFRFFSLFFFSFFYPTYGSFFFNVRNKTQPCKRRFFVTPKVGGSRCCLPCGGLVLCYR